MAYATVFLRVALGISFLSAVADRFGLWGAYEQLNVAWGYFSRFVQYTGKLNWFAPTAMIPVLAWTAMFAEIWLGAALVLGFFTRVAALLSGLMLLGFALTTTFALVVKAPLDFSVLSASAAAFVLAACGKYPLSVDALRSPHEFCAATDGRGRTRQTPFKKGDKSNRAVWTQLIRETVRVIPLVRAVGIL